MSWDSKTLAVLTLTWAALAVVYVTVFDMVTGARAWGAGAAIFLAVLLGVWYAERRGFRVRRPERLREEETEPAPVGAGTPRGSTPTR